MFFEHAYCWPDVIFHLPVLAFDRLKSVILDKLINALN